MIDQPPPHVSWPERLRCLRENESVICITLNPKIPPGILFTYIRCHNPIIGDHDSVKPFSIIFVYLLLVMSSAEKSPHVLLTGANGFVASHILAILINVGKCRSFPPIPAG